MTRQQKMLVALMFTGSFALGALSFGAPTGRETVDLVYRGLFVGVLSLAGSRARRWTLLFGAAAVTAGALALGLLAGASSLTVRSTGMGLVFGSAALLMAATLMVQNVRNRVFGACIGTFVGMACLRLDTHSALGAPSAVVVVAVAPMLWSGYTMSRSRARRVIRWVVGSFVVLMAAGVATAAYAGVAFAPDLRSAVELTTGAVDLAEESQTTEAGEQFERAAAEFDAVADDASSWWLFPARLVPVVSQNVEVIPVMSSAGSSLTRAAGTVATEVDYTRIRREGGGVDLELLEQFRRPVLDVSRRLDRALMDVGSIRSPWMVSPLRSRVDEFVVEVDGYRDQTELAELAIRHGPDLLGGSGERRYLVLLGNPAETGAVGGHVDDLAEVSLVDGRLSLVGVARPDAVPPNAAPDDPTSPTERASLDFPTAAAAVAAGYERTVGRQMDGVIYADPYALAAMLSITGPIPVPSIDRLVTSEDAVSFLTLDLFAASPTRSAAEDALAGFVAQVFDRLGQSTLPSPAELGDKFGGLVDQGRFRFVSVHPADHPLLERLGLDAAFAPEEGDDLLAVSASNANPSKIDTFLRRTIACSVGWDPATGAVASSVTITLRNDAPTSGLPDYVIGNSLGRPDGTNVTDLSVVSPFAATGASIDDVDAEVSSMRDGDLSRHTVRVEIPAGATRTVTVDLAGQVAPGGQYRLHYSGQPLVHPGTASVEVALDSPQHRVQRGPAIEVTSERTATAELEDAGQTVITVKARES